MAAFAAFALTGLVAGCEDDKGKQKVVAEDAGARDAGPAPPAIGGRLGEAVAAAAAGSPAQAPPAGRSDGGPPEGGVFAPGASLAALAKDTPYKIEVISEGAEPRVKLAAQRNLKAEQKLSVMLGLRMGAGQGLPNLDLGVTLKAEKPKEGGAGEHGAKPTATAVTAKVSSTTVASMSPGGPPRQLTDALAKLKGSSIGYRLSPENVASDFKVELAKDADPGLALVIEALGEALGLLTPPLPEQAVGAGAYWMVVDRVVASGAMVPVLRYRVFKLEKADGNAVSLSVDTRQYAENPEMKVPGGPDGGRELTLTLGRFESTGKGSLSWSPTSFAPGVAEVTQRLQALLLPPGGQPGGQQPNQRGSVAQVDFTVKVSTPAAATP